MDPWSQRVSPERIETIVQALLQAGKLTPTAPALILHDLDLLDARLRALHEQFPADTLHAVAIKANPLIALLKRCVSAGTGLEAASIEEVHLALAAGCPPERIVFDSPAKTEPELSLALSLGLHLNADNPEEISRIARLREQQPSTSTVGLRINPMLGEGTIRTTSTIGRSSRFGMPVGDDPLPLIELYAAHPWLCGLHVHVGSQGCDLDLLQAAAKRAESLIHQINDHLGRQQVTLLDIGGGLPTTYLSDQCKPGLETYVKALRSAAPGLFRPPLRLITEFGRALQANCGWAVSRVEYAKETDGQPAAIVHLGADFMLREAYHGHDWPHEFLVLDPSGKRKATTALRPWTIHGPLCFSGDQIGRDVMLPDIAPGDLLVVRDVGAYTLGMWSRHCSRGIPEIVGYHGDPEPRITTLRERETPADLVAFWQPTRTAD